MRKPDASGVFGVFFKKHCLIILNDSYYVWLMNPLTRRLLMDSNISYKLYFPVNRRKAISFPIIFTYAFVRNFASS